MKKLKVGIAGYGIVGKRRHKCIDNNPNMRLVAVCDRYFKGSGQLSEGVRYHDSYTELVADDLDALIVCVTNDIACEVVIAGLKRGLHVFCEKPPGRDLNDIARVMQVEKESDHLVLMYGFNHRYHDSIQDALKIIQSGNLGKIINLRGVYGKSQIVTFNQSDWRTKRSIAGGGVLLDQGIHMVDLMRLFAGEFIEVQSFVSNNYWNYDVEDNAYALMRTNAGVVGMLHSSATQWRHRFNLDINLEGGSLILGGLLTGTKSYGAETLIVARVDHEVDSGDPKEQLTRYNNDPSWQLELDSFCESIVSGSPLTHGTSQDAFDTMQLVYKIYYADPIWRDKYNIDNPSFPKF
ncbi:Gfo/Idh/MocA family oxidoreductase [Porticoccaceae bacterium]|nr:Gfo/Idh/MocA family oxidoreductase [Porticoccaceae bacterium]